MLLRELKSDGTYIGLRPSESTQALLQAWALESNVPLDDDLHVTQLYSRNVISPALSRDEHVATVIGFAILGEAIVAKLDAPSIVARHDELIALGGSHDFPEFIPHITLVAEPGTLKISDLKPLNFGMVFGNEYAEELDLS